LLDREERVHIWQRLARSWATRWDDFVEVVYPRLEGASRLLRTGWAWASDRPVVLRWAIVAASIATAIIFGFLAKDALQPQAKLLLFVPAVMVSALYGGLTAGSTAALLGALSAMMYFIAPGHKLGHGDFSGDGVALLLYSIACGIVLGASRAQERQKEQIQQFAETLESKVYERTAELRKANDELAEFCYTISHDLRAPMRNIVATTTFLAEDLGESANPTTRDQIVGLGRSANRLAKQVDDLLTHARLSSISIKPQWVNLTALADEVAAKLREEHWPYRLLNCRIQPGMVATGDRQLLKTVIEHLMENACKYAKAGEVLNLEISERRIKGVPCYCVKDNGIGFDMQYIDKVFQPFQKLHRDAEYPGTGIGLANVKRIIERHGGRVWAESIPGDGSAFYFTLQEKGKASDRPA
jgi:K+-sensing histidine kinase KdpD